MANYGRMYDRARRGMRGQGTEFTRRGYGDLGYGGTYRGGMSAGYGGMRSDNQGTDWNRFPGEEGWFGEGYAGYPGADWDQARAINRGAEFEGRETGFRGRETTGTRDLGYGGRETGLGYGRDVGIGYGRDIGAGYGGRNTWGRETGTDRGFGGTRSRGELGRVRASELMTENPETVTPDTAITDVAKKMRELDVGIIPVVDSDENRRLRGVVTDRDLAIRALAEGKDGKAKVKDCMSEDLHTVNKNDSIHEVLNLMERNQVRRVPVTDREGRLVGIIAQADLALDYSDNDSQELRVEHALERISEPARPRR